MWTRREKHGETFRDTCRCLLAVSLLRCADRRSSPIALRDAAARALEAIQKAQAPWYSTNKQVCASCHHQYQPALAYRVARDHGVPLNEAIARADAAKAFNFSDIDQRGAIHLRDRTGRRRCLSDGGGARGRRQAEPRCRRVRALADLTSERRRGLGRIPSASAVFVQPGHDGRPRAASRAALSPCESEGTSRRRRSHARACSSKDACLATPRSAPISCLAFAGPGRARDAAEPGTGPQGRAAS